MPTVSEAAVVGYPHDIKGQGIYAYVTLMDGRRADATRCARSWSRWVRKEIGPIASPDVIQFAPGLPKTRSGKIMRRILRKIAENDFGALGDTSTLADPARGRGADRRTGRTRARRRLSAAWSVGLQADVVEQTSAWRPTLRSAILGRGQRYSLPFLTFSRGCGGDEGLGGRFGGL